MGMDQYTGPAWRDDTVSYKKNKKIFILFYSRYNMPCATSFLKLIGTESSSLAANSILTWRGSISDHRGVSSRARLLHCTLIWLTPAITANVGNSTVQFLVVGVCVRAHPLLYPMKKQSTEKGVAAMICFGHHPSLPRGLANLLCIIPLLLNLIITLVWPSVDRVALEIHFCRLRPYHDEHTRSRLITEVKHRRAGIVLGWGTAWEHPVP